MNHHHSAAASEREQLLLNALQEQRRQALLQLEELTGATPALNDPVQLQMFLLQRQIRLDRQQQQLVDIANAMLRDAKQPDNPPPPPPP